MASLAQDFSFAARTLRKSPVFTIIAILTLALGIGANTVIFSVVNAVLLRSLPLQSYKDPGALVMLWGKNPALSGFIANRVTVPLKNFLDWKQQARSFESFSAWQVVQFNIGGSDSSNGRPEQVSGLNVAANFFTTFGVQPAVGRSFAPEESRTAAHVVILTNALAQRRFGKISDALGKVMRLNSQQYTVVGVLPRQFRLPSTYGGMNEDRTQLYTPLNIDPHNNPIYRGWALFVVARLRRGVTLEQARSEMDAIAKRQEREDEMNRGYGVNIFPLSAEDVTPELRRSLLVLQIAVGFVLLIACSNLANLFLTRALGRQREIAIRQALGAGRGQIVRQLLAESLLLSFTGGALGLLLANWGMAVVSAVAPSDTHGFHELRLDGYVLAYTLLVVVVAALLFGLWPALQVSRQRLNEALSQGGRTVASGSHKMRGALVITEVALALLLLVGTGLMIRSIRVLLDIDPGFQPAHLLKMNIALPEVKYPNDEQKQAFCNRLLDTVSALPGVKAASISTGLPLEDISETGYQLPDAKTRQPMLTDYQGISEDYFEAMGQRLVLGRKFTRRETENRDANVLIVNEVFARQNWPNQNPIGKVLLMGDHGPGHPNHQIVIGEAADTHQLGPDSESRVEVYVPMRRLGAFALEVRTQGSPETMVQPIQRAVWNIDKEQPVFRVESMDELMRDQLATRRFNMLVLGFFGLLALVLAIIGLYGVLAYGVSQRIREIGVRVALGATPDKISELFLRSGLRLALIGVGVGIVGALLLTQYMQSLIYGITPDDPITFISVAALLAIVAAIASYLPARRAARIDPLEALRSE